MAEITWDGVCFIYTLMQEGFAVNKGVVIISAMKKAHYHQGYRYGLRGLLTHFTKGHEVKKEALDYILVIDMHPIDLTQIQGLDITHDLSLTLLKCHN